MYKFRLYIILYWNMLLKRLGLKKDKDHDNFIY